MAITDDWGATWQFSEPLVGGGNIQPSIVIKSDGTLVAYMRDNGPPPKRLQYAESKDGGMSWSTVHDSHLPNPGSGADIVTLKNGHWCLVYNDTENGRYSLAVSISDDEGKSKLTLCCPPQADKSPSEAITTRLRVLLDHSVFAHR